MSNINKSSSFNIPVGFGMPNISGGGKGSYTKLPSLTGQLKSKLTEATKDVGEEAKAMNPANVMFPATTEFFNKKQQQQGVKIADLTTGSVMRGLGYGPGVWYDKDKYSPAAETRFGNLVTGAGISTLGLAAIPILQYLYPERFKGKGRNMAAMAVLGGMAAPWAANLPSTLLDINKLRNPADAQWTPEAKANMIERSRSYTGIDPTKPYGAPVVTSSAANKAPAFGSPGSVAPHVPDLLEVIGNLNKQQAGGALTPQEQKDIEQAGTQYSGSTAKVGNYIPMDLQIAKTHLADVLAEQLSSGYVDYGQAAGLMLRANQENNQPWVTVGGLARAAVGAGAGALAGMVAAKGIGMFMNVSPSEQKAIRNTGAALGTLINLGKLRF